VAGSAEHEAEAARRAKIDAELQRRRAQARVQGSVLLIPEVNPCCSSLCESGAADAGEGERARRCAQDPRRRQVPVEGERAALVLLRLLMFSVFFLPFQMEGKQGNAWGELPVRIPAPAVHSCA